MTTFATVILWILLPVLFLIVFLGWALETRSDRAKRWHKSGVTKAEIGRRFNVNRYQVNKLLAA